MIPINKSTQSSGRRTMASTLSMAALILGATQAQAASVSFQSPTPFTASSILDAPLSLSGYTGATLVEAQNFGDIAKTVSTPGGQTINFADAPESFGGPTGTVSAVFFGGSEWNPGLFTGNTGSATFDDVLDSQSWASSQPGNRQTVRIGSLSIGQTYIVQLFFSDMRGGNGGRTQFLADATSGGNSSAEFSTASSTSVIGTFVASGAFQDVFLFPGLSTSAPNDTTVAAFTLYSATAIPEPSTFAALVGALALGAVALRRRRSASV